MKIFGLSLLAAAVLIGSGPMPSDAAVLVLGGPGIELSAGQPIQAVIVDSNGNTLQQTVYYNPSIGGVDLNASWTGPNSSIYFPSLDNGFVWYNGFWVDKSGYYWNGGKRLVVDHPHWGNYWGGYWQNRGHWHGGDWHGSGGHGNEWHGGEHGNDGQRGEWQGSRGHGEEWRGGHDGERRGGGESGRGHENGHGRR